MTPEQITTIERYAALAARMQRLEEAEARAFGRWFHDRTPSRAGTVRKAASRVNRLSADLASAEDAVYAIMDRLADAAEEQPEAVQRAVRQASLELLAEAVAS